jgi:hypothetical protein
MNKRDGKRQFTALREAVSQALRNADPIGLIHGGAPLNEYDPEVGTVLPRLRHVTSCGDVQKILHEEFVHWLGPEVSGDIRKYEKAAESIWAILTSTTPP